jgi:hypothetical protein
LQFHDEQMQIQHMQGKKHRGLGTGDTDREDSSNDLPSLPQNPSLPQIMIVEDSALEHDSLDYDGDMFESEGEPEPAADDSGSSEWQRQNKVALEGWGVNNYNRYVSQ